MKLALIIRDGFYELTLGPETSTEQHTLQLLYDAGISTRGDISIKASHAVGGPDRLWITIRKSMAEGQSDA